MKLYRLYVGGDDAESIGAVLQVYNIASFTYWYAGGYWNGKHENSIVVEIIAERELPDIRHIAHMMGARLAEPQQCIMLTSQDVAGGLVQCEPKDPATDRQRNQA